MTNTKLALTENFFAEEFAVSASFPELVRPVPGEFIPNVKRLAGIMEKARPHVGPMKIISGYRSELLNRMVDGSPTSQHVRAEACDISVALPLELFRFFVRNAEKFRGELGQVIYYPKKSFVHISLPSSRYPVVTPCVHMPPRYKYQIIPAGTAGVDWLLDHLREMR